MKKTSKELKLCPFCGNNVEITEERDIIGESWYRIDCDHCCTHSYIYSDKAKLIKEWNGRPELLPCPICGSPAEIDASEYGSAVFCTKCGVHTDAFDDEKEAVKTWNRRKSSQRIIDYLAGKLAEIANVSADKPVTPAEIIELAERNVHK